jgi:hypothetical protein
MDESGVLFEEGQTSTNLQHATKEQGLLDLVQKWGFAKDRAKAENFLLIVFAVALLATGVICLVFLLPHKPTPLPTLNPPVRPSSP